MSVKAPKNPVRLVLNPTRVMGMNIMAWANMMGITPTAFTFRGMYWRHRHTACCPQSSLHTAREPCVCLARAEPRLSYNRKKDDNLKKEDDKAATGGVHQTSREF